MVMWRIRQPIDEGHKQGYLGVSILGGVDQSAEEGKARCHSHPAWGRYGSYDVVPTLYQANGRCTYAVLCTRQYQEQHKSTLSLRQNDDDPLVKKGKSSSNIQGVGFIRSAHILRNTQAPKLLISSCYKTI